jgi:hypothetical protein
MGHCYRYHPDMLSLVTKVGTKSYIEQDPDPVFFQRSDSDPVQNCLDPQHCFFVKLYFSAKNLYTARRLKEHAHWLPHQKEL